MSDFHGIFLKSWFMMLSLVRFPLIAASFLNFIWKMKHIDFSWNNVLLVQSW